MEGNDMITNLYRLPKLEDRKDTIQIKRAFVGDKGTILNFIKDNFSDSWVYEAEHAIMQEVPKCSHDSLIVFQMQSAANSEPSLDA